MIVLSDRSWSFSCPMYAQLSNARLWCGAGWQRRRNHALSIQMSCEERGGLLCYAKINTLCYVIVYQLLDMLMSTVVVSFLASKL